MDRRTFLVTTAAVATVTITADKIATARARFAALQHCAPGCPGWCVMDVARGTEPWTEIERCDACCYGSDLTDDDAALLPEAQAALRKELQQPIEW